MRIIYLDQNKWIDLARAAKSPTEFPDLYALLVSLARDVEAGRLVLPLSSTTIYETHKINDPDRRRHLAFVQATLSRGRVFCGRHRRLVAEVTDVLADAYGLAREVRPETWFLSDLFLEAFADYDDPRVGLTISPQLIEAMQNAPHSFLFDYLGYSSDTDRTAAVAEFSTGSQTLLKRMETRRTALLSEKLPMRRRIYGAMLLFEEIERVLTIAQQMGIACATVSELGSSNARRLVREVPILSVELELAVRIENQARGLQENDLRDMQAFCAVMPYANLVVAENQFVNLAVQAKLPEKYKTGVSTDIFAISQP